MPVKVFSIIASIGMVMVIAAASFLKKLSHSYAAMSKTPLFAGLLISILDAVFAFCAAYFIDDDSFLLFWVLCGLFLIMGIVHVLVTDKYFVQEEDEKENNIISAQVIYTVGVMLFTAVLLMIAIFFLINKNFLFYPLMFSALAFLIPLIFYFTYSSVMRIPLPTYRLWEYPKQKIDPPEDNYNERLLVIGFSLKKKSTDKKNTFFRAKAPEGINLGELFYHFINDYNELQSETPIEFTDQNNVPAAWWFRKKSKWFQQDKILDPGITVRENKIKENSIIICEHVNQ